MKEIGVIMTPILLELVAPMLSCPEINSLRLRSEHRSACINEYPDDWKYAVHYLSEWIQELSNLYRHRIVIRVIDALSPLGLWKQIRYRLFRFPAFIVDRKSTYIGWDYQELETLIDERIHNVGRNS
jgi:hypothetical protein